ncbi:MAG: response regulator transcription factor [Deltaproteobacteria bacterium]|nr:response regulator transcription factor [Deltaproteobacteria bacterium]
MRILLVEDEAGVAGFIRKGLEEEQYAVDHAEDAEAALELAALGQYDAMVVDVMLPGMDGLAFCRTLRGRQDATPVLMLTVKSGVKEKVAGLDSGADDYLSKPFSFEEFLARIRALLRRRPRQVVGLACGALSLDSVDRQAAIRGRRMDLRPKEFALLEFLVRNQGRVMSRTRILENVWGYDFDPGTNVVDVHIKRLREKLAEDQAGAEIRTVRGVGYTLSALQEDTPGENVAEIPAHD